MNTKIFLSIIAVLIVLGIGGAIISSKQESAPGKYDALATCITNSGAKFYGAFWCPHCKKQKELFGTSARLLPYIECSKPDGTQNDTCKTLNIASYPTWELADGTRLETEEEANGAGVTLKTLAEKTQCVATLPQPEE